MALDSTTGAATAESFVSVTDADAYWANHNSPLEWEEAITSELESSLRYATQYLEQNFTWLSTIYETTQALGWPRSSYSDSEGRSVGGAAVIPQKVKDATCEMALQYLKEDFSSPDNENVLSESIGSASITYRSSSKTYSFMKIMLREYGLPDKSSNPRLYRG